jgi:hypothetical protein
MTRRCRLGCMAAITAEAVFAACRELLTGNSKG